MNYLGKIHQHVIVCKSLGIKTWFKYFKTRKNKNIKDNTIYEDYSGEKIVVYTAIFGNIDNVLQPEYTNENIEYVIITDQDIPSNSIWKKYDKELPPQLQKLNNKMKNRYCKLFPEVFFEQYKYSIYVDGNIKIKGDISPLVNKLMDNCIGIFKHPLRNDIYIEAAAVIYLNNARPEEVVYQLQQYKKEGFPVGFGLYENSIIVREHKNAVSKKIMYAWWEQLNTYTQRDQLSLMYVVWKCGYDKTIISSLGTDIDQYINIERINHINK